MNILFGFCAICISCVKLKIIIYNELVIAKLDNSRCKLTYFVDICNRNNHDFKNQKNVPDYRNNLFFNSFDSLFFDGRILLYDYYSYGVNDKSLYEELFHNEFQENPYYLLDTIGEERSLADDKFVLLSFNIVGNSFGI